MGTLNPVTQTPIDRNTDAQIWLSLTLNNCNQLDPQNEAASRSVAGFLSAERGSVKKHIFARPMAGPTVGAAHSCKGGHQMCLVVRRNRRKSALTIKNMNIGPCLAHVRNGRQRLHKTRRNATRMQPTTGSVLSPECAESADSRLFLIYA